MAHRSVSAVTETAMIAVARKLLPRLLWVNTST